jgi:hypothetical protein
VTICAREPITLKELGVFETSRLDNARDAEMYKDPNRKGFLHLFTRMYRSQHNLSRSHLSETGIQVAQRDLTHPASRQQRPIRIDEIC